jgi:hypothetical protein
VLTLPRQIAIAITCVVTVLLAQSPAQSADSAPESVGKAWKARAEAATKKLASPGLDKCDKAVELSFQQPNEVTSGTKRSFELMIEIDKQAMVASYSYEGQRLTAFVLLALPPGWLAIQKTDSKNLNILVVSANCSFDLCTRDPFTPGPCQE